jgi:F0F1-type ATP synthase assembly protein I
MISAMANTYFRRENLGSNYARSIAVSFTLVAVLAVLSGIGLLLDRVLGTLPLFLLTGLAVGFAGGLYYLYLLLKKMDRS